MIKKKAKSKIVGGCSTSSRRKRQVEDTDPYTMFVYAIKSVMD
jgi:hypothetical protein